MGARFALVAAGLFSLGEAILLALFLLSNDDPGRHVWRVVDAAWIAAFAAAAAFALLTGRASDTTLPTPPCRRGRILLGVAAALVCVGHLLRLNGLLMAGAEPMSGPLVAGHVTQAVGAVLVGGSMGLSLWLGCRAGGTDGPTRPPEGITPG